jgi:hypothetical protein
MENFFKKMQEAIAHLNILHEVFNKETNYTSQEKEDIYDIYKQNSVKLDNLVRDLNLSSQLYSEKGRQMILADLIEYILLGRGYYSIKNKEDKGQFIEMILHLVNMLMVYDTLTVSKNLRDKFLQELVSEIPEVASESKYSDLNNFSGKVGLKKGESEAPKELDKYFDSLLPKTAGGLWHELLVYVFLLRSDVGYVLPLLLSQRILSLRKDIVPPDFLIITYDKHIYGIEVGTKKEIQSGSFSLQTSIPTATLDTENSRVSDRCPICKKWILFCDFVIEKYSDLDQKIEKSEVRCLEDCDKYSTEDIAKGLCPFTKYSRNMAKTLGHAKHKYTNGLHYHYKCVLKNVSEEERDKIIQAKDKVALKTHFPYYSGIEELINKQEDADMEELENNQETGR